MGKKILLCDDPVLLKAIHDLQFKETFLLKSRWPKDTKIFRCINEQYLVQLSLTSTGLTLPFGMVPDSFNPTLQLCDVEPTQDMLKFIQCVERHVQSRLFPKFHADLADNLLRLTVTSRTQFCRQNDSGELVLINTPQLHPGSVIVPVMSMGLIFFNHEISGLTFLIDHVLVVSANDPQPQPVLV